MQVGNVIGDVERTFHVVRDDNAGHPKALLQPVNQAIDTVRDYRIKARCRLIVQYARGPANDGACETNSLLHSTAQTLRHLIFCPSISMTSSISSTFACSNFGSRSPASRS